MTTFAPEHEAAAKATLGLYPIGEAMHASGLPASFVVEVIHRAVEFEGIRFLLQMWREVEGQEERKQS